MRDTRRTRIVLAVLLLVSFTLITLDVRGGDSGPVGAIRSATGTVFGPVQRAVAAVYEPVRNFFGGLGHDEHARLVQLEKENTDLTLRLRTSQYAESRAAELDALLKVAGLGQYRIVPAQVIAVGPAQGFAWTALLDAGSRDGLKVGMTVINGDGLVGRVKSVTNSTATVLLLVDGESTVGSRLEGGLTLSLANGQGGNQPMQLQVLDPRVALTSGDRVVTRGSDFVSGVPIGVVTKVQPTQGTLVRVADLQPYVDVRSLDLVGVVVQGPRTNPRDSVLPPRPSAGPSASASPSATASPSGSAGATASAGPSASASPSR
ncbi:MAG TPA: rod shape-determining protein MreC [Actinomycetes bacterium]